MPASRPRKRAPPRPRRTPSVRAYGSLSRTEIVEAALSLADSEGIDRLSMRSLAKALDSAPMSLYRHFGNRAELEQALVDFVIGNAGLGHPEGPAPHAYVRSVFVTIRASLLAHPGVLPLLGTRSSFGPAGMAALERILLALERAGLPPERAAQAFHILLSFTLGATVTEAHMRLSFAAGGAGAPRDLVAALSELPRVSDRAEILIAQMSDGGFEASLDRVLEGILPPMDGR